MRKVHYARGAEGARWKKKKQDRASKDRPLHHRQIAAEKLSRSGGFARAVFIGRERIL
jgi:hypothetical protein